MELVIPASLPLEVGAITMAKAVRQSVKRARMHYPTIEPIFIKYHIFSVLDIGCGLAVMDIMLAKFAHVHTFHLLDGIGKGPKQQYTASAVEPWGSVHWGYDLMRANVPEDVSITKHVVADRQDTERANRNLEVPVDMVMSLRSWGHHYPTSTYAELASRSLKSGGLLLLDIRAREDKQEMQCESEVIMQHGFYYPEIVSPPKESKCIRCLFQRV